jgi:hypothetical protein
MVNNWKYQIITFMCCKLGLGHFRAENLIADKKEMFQIMPT